MNTSSQNHCPQCSTPLPADAPGGLCPQCVMALNFGPETIFHEEATAIFLPSIEELSAHFPQLEIIELLGRGGMGAVYKARQKQLDRMVALKILPPGIGEKPSFAERFTREARALAKLHHPKIVTLYEFGEAGGLFYFLMEFVDGLNLRQLLDAGNLRQEEALAIVPQICEALQFAHDQGIVHRDIKPENILLDRRGQVKVADFGLAKIMQVESETPGEDQHPPESPDLSMAGKVMGTPSYMAPEQTEHPDTVDHRADIYALGVVFYQMLTGELPVGRFAAPSRKVQIDVRLDEVVLRALEKEPELRYQQASVLKTQVETIASEAGSTTETSADKHSSYKMFPWSFGEINDDGFRFYWDRIALFYLFGSGLALLFSMLIAALMHRHDLAVSRSLFWASLIPLPATVSLMLSSYRQAHSDKKTNGPDISPADQVITPNLKKMQGEVIFLCIGIVILATLFFILLSLTQIYPRQATGPFILMGFCAFGLVVGGVRLAGFWPFPPLFFPQPNFSSRNLAPRKTTSADIIAPDLNKQRREVVWWSFWLTVTFVGMGLNLKPVEQGLGVAIWGVLLFLISTSMALLAGKDPGKIKLASQLVLINGIVAASAIIWCSLHSSSLAIPWRPVIIFPCLGGIVFCLSSLVRCEKQGAQSPNNLGVISFFFALMSMLLPMLCYWFKPIASLLTQEVQGFMLWLTLLSSLLAVSLGLIARKSRTGFSSIILGGMSLSIWILFFVAGLLSPSNLAAQNSNRNPEITEAPLKSTVTQAVQSWLSLMDRGNYAESWQQAAESFHDAVTQEKWVSMSAAIRKPLGQMLSRTSVSLQRIPPPDGFPAGDYAEAHYDTSFEKLAAAKETVTMMQEKDGLWRTIAYLILPDESQSNGNSKPSSPAEKSAVTGAQSWLTEIDEGKYSQSWKDTDVYFQKAVTDFGWSTTLTNVRQPLGALVSRKLKSVKESKSLPGAPDGDYVVMQFDTSFAQKKNAVETVTFIRQADGTWRAIGYYIR